MDTGKQLINIPVGHDKQFLFELPVIQQQGLSYARGNIERAMRYIGNYGHPD
jgi:hypothetical protein